MNDRTFILSVAALARRAPDEWRAFLHEFSGYVARRKDDCVQAADATVQVAQGRARACVELDNLFKEAVNTADRIKTGGK